MLAKLHSSKRDRIAVKQPNIKKNSDHFTSFVFTEKFIGITPIPVLIPDCELHKHSIYSRRVVKVLADTLCFVLHPPFIAQPVGRISLLFVGWLDYVTQSAVPTGRACKFKLD